MTDKKSDVKVNIKEQQPCAVVLDIEVPHPEVSEETERVYQDIQKAARVPGFRAGKAPMDIIKKNYTGTAREKVIENLIRRTLYSSFKSQGVEPIDSPTINEVSFEFDKPFTYTVRAERHPEVKAKDYKGIKITKEIHPVTPERVKEQIEALRDRNARLAESKSDTVTDKSFVVADYVCFKNGEPVNELKAKNQMIDLSSSQTIPGFKEGLAGAKKDEERDVNVTFPQDHPNKKIAGQAMTFKVKVLGIKEKELPALDDEFAKDFNLKDLAELEAKVRESLEAEEKKRQDQEVEKQIVDHLVKANEFAVPDSLVTEQLNYLLKRMENYLRGQGLSADEWNKNIDRWREKYKPEAERNVRVSYILNSIADEEKLNVTDDDLKAEFERLKSSNAERVAEVEKYFNEQKGTIASHLKEEKLFKFLLDNAKVKEEIKEAKEEPKKA